MHSLYNDILIQELKKYRDKKILVAFSGGKDSLMLLDFINKQKESLNIYAGMPYSITDIFYIIICFIKNRL